MKKNLLFVLAIGLAFAACEKEKSTESINEERIILKNGKYYSKDSIMDNLALVLRVDRDTFQYKKDSASVYIKSYNLEVDPVDFLVLK